MEHVVIENEESGQRLDKLLALRFGEKSRSYFQYLIEEKCVLLNGNPTKKRAICKEGDEIEIFFLLTKDTTLEPENIPLEIIYEDEELIAINKPAGMVVHPANGNWSHTFVNALLFYCKSLYKETGSLRPGIVHRLDKDTSGLLLAAKTERAQKLLMEAFSKREIEKEYLAITYGRPKDGPISEPIGRHKIRRQEMCITPDGKTAASIIETIAEKKPLCLTKIKLLTGRTHQARLHLRHLGAPILGDAIYGNKNANLNFKVERQLLHAHSLKFNHPIEKKALHLTAPPPLDMKNFICQLTMEKTVIS